MHKFLKVFSLSLVAILGFLFIDAEPTLGASGPYDVPRSVERNWDNIKGSRDQSMTSGRRIVYDVYSNKFINGGYRIVNRNFGEGTQPYINFEGWSILFGHKKHTYANKETYIVASKVGSNEERIYSTRKQRSLSATKDLEYNRQGPTGLWNECPSSARNKVNTECNFRYNNVDFQAFLPIEELFPDPAEEASWDLYIVVEIDGRIVYDELVLPFNFDSLSHQGGEITLSSGVNANRLLMISTDVIRRTSAFGGGSGHNLGYFTAGRTYTRVSQVESETAVWYGVRSPHDNNRTRWAASAYWLFSGDQARLSFDPETTKPEHRSHGISNHRYKNGEHYWVRPNDRVNIRLRGFDRHSLLNRTVLRLRDSNNSVDVRSRYTYPLDSLYNLTNYRSSHVNVLSARKSYESSTNRTREATFTVRPRTHNHRYSVYYYHRDNVGNSIGYRDTGMDLRVDGKDPGSSTYEQQEIVNARYVDGNDHWIRPSDRVDIRLRGYDQHSKLNRNSLQLQGSGAYGSARYLFDRYQPSNIPAGFDYNNPSIYFDILSGKKTYETSTSNTRETTFTVRPKSNTHGHSYNVSHWQQDNVGNNTGWVDTGLNLRMDGEAPEHVSHRISGHAYQSGNNYWVKPDDNVKIALRSKDNDSKPRLANISIRDTSKGVDARLRHYFAESPNSYQYYRDDSTNIKAIGVNRTYSSSNDTVKEVTYEVSPQKHGHNYDLRYQYSDNVKNNTSWGTDIDSRIRVDGEAPTVSLSPNGSDWANNNLNVSVNVSDNDSGVKRFRYRTYQDGKWSSYSSWITNRSSETIRLTTNGLNRIQVQTEDNVGNTRTVTSNDYFIDKVGPNATFNPNSKSWTNENISVSITATDNHSGVKRMRYRVYQNGSWGAYQSWTSSNKANVTLSANGLNRIQVQVEDNAGNSSTFTSGNYYIDKVDPTGVFNPNSKSWTNENVKVGISTSDSHSGVKRMRYRIYQNGSWGSYSSWMNRSSTNVDLIANGRNQIQVQIEDVAGNRSTITSGNYYIDKVNPEGSFSPHSRSWTNENIKVGVSTSDEHSGVKRIRYRVYQNNSWGSYSSWVNGSSTDISLTANGRNQIQVQIEDNAGNTRTITSGNYYIDKVNPEGTFNPHSHDWTNENIRVAISTSDEHSGVKRIRYRVYQNNSWGSYNSWMNRSSTDVNLTANGLNRIQVQIEDVAGNVHTVTSGDYHIDKVKPNLSFRNKADTRNFTSRDWAPETIEVKLKASDTHSGVQRIRYAWSTSSITPSNWSNWVNSTNVDVSQSKEGEWYLHAQVEDKAGNRTTDVAGVYKLDKTAPDYDANANTIENAQFVNGNDYWTQPGRTLNVTLRQIDKLSGNEYNSIRLSGNGADVQARHHLKGSSTNFTILSSNRNVSIASANRTEYNTSNGAASVKWGVNPVTHGHSYDVQYKLADTAGNETNNYLSTNKKIRVDGEAPTVAFRNKADSSDFNSRDWSNETIEVLLKVSDPDSGVKRSRYAWTTEQQTPTESEWSSWSTNPNYVVSKDEAGEWYLYVETEDNVGNKRVEKAGVYKLNNPPEADFTYEGHPEPIYEGDPLTLINTSTDEDGHDMTAVWTITDPDGNTETLTGKLIDPHGSATTEGHWNVTINDLTDPTNPKPIAGDYVIHLEVTDQYDGKSEIEDTINVRPLQISGSVLHTERWKEIHQELGNGDNEFFSGERFILNSTVTNNSISTPKDVQVEVAAEGIDINNSPVSLNTTLTEQSRTGASISHHGELYEEFMSEPNQKFMDNSNMTFEFKATWSNGVVKYDTITIQFLNDVYDFYDLHRTN